ncbi:MAG: aminopeptidase P family protein [Tissierellia bacterium]|nr:aminopeptidase P family protein [Tissierellia bacterium]
MTINQRINRLRQEMEREGIQALIVDTKDPHQSEYLPSHYQARRYLTGFTGSNGLALVSKDQAKIWTDGRYFIQCQNQIADSEFELMKMSTPGYPSVKEYVLENFSKGDKVATNTKIISEKEYRDYRDFFAKAGIDFVHSEAMEKIWESRPPLPKEEVFLLDLDYAGEARSHKLDRYRESLKELGAKSGFISSLEDICWLLNIRGRDIPNNPVTISYLYVTLEGALLFIHQEKIHGDIRKKLEKDQVHLVDYDRIVEAMNSIEGSKIALDISRNPHYLVESLSQHNDIIQCQEITAGLKSIKNERERKNLRAAYIEDGVALSKFIYWVKNQVKKEDLGEFDAASYLHGLREKRRGFIEESFTTIAAYGANGAMMHYTATKENQAPLKAEGFLLVDSGGQYLLGTTDTTRTLVLGALTEEEIHDFTLVLKASIAILRARFLEGTKDADLDILARYPLWQEGMDYKSGTGHGVGYLLSVHEDPPRISFNNPKPVRLQEGQMVTVEPGVYKEGKHGIRTENTVLVQKDIRTPDGQFYRLENLTRCPIDREAIDPSLLTEEELDWLNDYHEQVYQDLKDYLEEDEVNWLRQVTQPLEKKATN